MNQRRSGHPATFNRSKSTAMKIKTQDFRVPAGNTVDLAQWPTRVKPAYASKKQYHKRLDEQVEELSSLQRLHYASNG